MAKRSSKAQSRSLSKHPLTAQLRQAITQLNAGQLAEAQASCLALLKRDPKHADTHHVLGLVQQRLGDQRLAITHFRQAIDENPRVPEYPYNLGVSLLAIQQYAMAADALQEALALAPQQAEIYTNLGVAYQEMGRVHDALAAHERAVALQPNLAAAHANLGLVLDVLGDVPRALAHYERALHLDPRSAISHHNLGKLLNENGAMTQAITHLRQALRLRPDYAHAHCNLANALLACGEVAAAQASYRQALVYDPRYTAAHSNFLMSLHYSHDITPQAVYTEHRRWAMKHAGREAPEIAPAHPRGATRRLRLGYVSGDFRRHSVSFFIAPVLEAHDPEQVEVFCYANVRQPDAVTAHLQHLLGANWRDIANLRDSAAAALIRRDQIDILVDLSGHTAHNRLKLFALEPAPVQATYLGYPDTTGLHSMHYRLTDAWADPPGLTEHLHTETLWRLPEGFLCYQPPLDCPPCPPPPMLQHGQVTFGSFNMISKVSPQTIAVWSQILRQVPGSRLLLKSRGLEPATIARLERDFSQHGIDPGRLTCVPFVPGLRAHLQLYSQIDIALDTLPYNGTTTTFEALWMGRPVLTVAGDTHVSRVGCSILSRLQLQELIARDQADYVQRAVALASSPGQLQHLSTTLRSRMHAHSLLDAKQFTRHLEQAYRGMWQAWCDHPPRQQDRPGESVRMRGDLTIALPDTLERITPYVLREQEDWFEQEIVFVRRLLQPGMQVLDIGANYGVYTLALAAGVGHTGAVWAFEPAATTAAWLQRSLAQNAMPHVEVVMAALSHYSGTGQFSDATDAEGQALRTVPGSAASTEVKVWTLDAAGAMFDWQALHFIKLDAEGEEANILRGGEQTLQRFSPLIMYEVKHGDHLDADLPAQLAGYGYRSYRLLPGLQLLVPLSSLTALDSYALNLFACKDDCAATLEARGLLARTLPSVDMPSVSPPQWLPDFATAYPYAIALGPLWQANWAQRAPGGDTWAQALQGYEQAHRGNWDASTSASLLLSAYTGMQRLANQHPTLGRLLTLARLAFEVGQRQQAVTVLQKLLNLFTSATQTLRLDDEPFLPPTARYACLDPGQNLGNWALSTVLEQLEKLHYFSSYWEGPEALERLETIRQLGFQSPEMERRRQLIRMRFGQQATPEATAVLSTASADNLNIQYWQSQV